MEKLHNAISNLGNEFDKLMAEVSTNINSVADVQRELSLRKLQAAQAQKGVDVTGSAQKTDECGILAEAELIKEDLRASNSKIKEFGRQLEQLEQIYMISEELKNMVKKLEQQIKV